MPKAIKLASAMPKQDQNSTPMHKADASDEGVMDCKSSKASKAREPEALITFQIRLIHRSHEPAIIPKHLREFTIPLRLAMDASAVLKADFEGREDNYEHHVVSVEVCDAEVFALFVHYMYRDDPTKASTYVIPKEFPKMELWTECFSLANKFSAAGLKKYLTRKIKHRLLELEESDVLSEEYMRLIRFVDNEKRGFNWLREIIVDAKRDFARSKREHGISLEDELPTFEEDWGAPFQFRDSSSSSSSSEGLEDSNDSED